MDSEVPAMTEPRIDIHHWSCSIHACCPSCLSFHWYCPACGSGQGRQLPDASITFPATGGVACSECGLTGLITLLGWHPTTQLQQAFDLPAAQRPQPPATPRQSSSSSSQKRLPIRQWRRTAEPALRRRLQGVSAEAIGEAHRSRGLEFQYVLQSRYGGGGHHRAYSRSELIAALDLIATQQGGRRG